MYNNIKPRELPALLRSSYEANGGNMELAARDLETIDLMLGTLKLRSLIAARDRSARSRWSKGRNLTKILEQIITR